LYEYYSQNSYNCNRTLNEYLKLIEQHLENGEPITSLITQAHKDRNQRNYKRYTGKDMDGDGTIIDDYKKSGPPQKRRVDPSSSADAPGLPVNASAPSRSSADAGMEDGDDSQDAPAIGDLSIGGGGGGEGDFGYDGGADDDYGYGGGGKGTIIKPCNVII
jgi:hypothetical protein